MSLVRRSSATTATGSALAGLLGVSALVLALVAGAFAVQASGAAAEAPRAKKSAGQDAEVVAYRQAVGGAGADARLTSFAGTPIGGPRSKILGALPVLSYRGAADPTVVRYAGGWLAVSTGPAAPRAVAPSPGGPWTNIPSALTVLPSWALSGRIWASDLVQVGSQWLLYFSAEVAGVGLDGRCIGVATATDPAGTFVPDEQPLVCPRQAVAPSAYDKIKRRGKGMPKQGVIDPEYFKDRGGQQYLLYRTQGVPSAIRIVALPASGRPEGKERSAELVRSDNVIENPTVIRKGRQYVLITSEGDFVGCSYETTYRKSVRLLDWSRSKRQVLMNASKTGLCGPGGADLGRGPNNERMLFFHAWTCPTLGNCPPGIDYDRNRSVTYDARRSMFAGTLRFTKSKSPRIAAWVAPIAPPPPPPVTPTPTPCVTATPTATVTVTGSPTSTPTTGPPVPTASCTTYAPTQTVTVTVAPSTPPAAPQPAAPTTPASTPASTPAATPSGSVEQPDPSESLTGLIGRWAASRSR